MANLQSFSPNYAQISQQKAPKLMIMIFVYDAKKPSVGWSSNALCWKFFAAFLKKERYVSVNNIDLLGPGHSVLFIRRLYRLGWPTFQTVFVSSLKRYKVTANSIKVWNYVKICEMIRNYIKVDKDVAARQLEAAWIATDFDWPIVQLTFPHSSPIFIFFLFIATRQDALPRLITSLATL